MTTEKRVLWVDDDGEKRFGAQIDRLRSLGLLIDWAEDARTSIDRLRQQTYECVLLDQVFPMHPRSSYKDVWSGCRLLYWLRGEPPPPEAPQGASWSKTLKGQDPLAKNRTIPVLIISGFQDWDVDRAMYRIDKNLIVFPKPVDTNKLLETVKLLVSEKLP